MHAQAHHLDHTSIERQCGGVLRRCYSRGKKECRSDSRVSKVSAMELNVVNKTYKFDRALVEKVEH